MTVNIAKYKNPKYLPGDIVVVKAGNLGHELWTGTIISSKQDKYNYTRHQINFDGNAISFDEERIYKKL